MKTAIFLLSALILFSADSYGQVTADDLSWDFECGSLESASTQAPNSININLRLDDQHGDLYGWYFFKIDRNAEEQTVTFRIMNRDGWMNTEDKPVYSYDQVDWLRVDESWMNSNDLFFQHHFTHDSVWIAQCIPYGYSKLLEDLDSLSSSPYIEYEFIGESVHGRQIPLVTISDTRIPDNEKRCVWITSRQHPMETPPSFTIKGMMEYLAGVRDEGGEELLERLIFKFVPMVNVDGVAEGYSRHNVNGINLNRVWCSDSTYSGEEPEVEVTHRAIDEWIYGGNWIDYYNDMHAAPDYYDFGFRLSESYSYGPYYADVTTYLKHLQIHDVYHNWTRWRDLDQNYALGVVIMALFDQHGLLTTSNEHSWVMRYNGQYHTIDDLLSEGPMYLRAIDAYLFPLGFTNRYGQELEQFPNEEIYITVIDFDENSSNGMIDTIAVTVSSEANGDIEGLSLQETYGHTGVFINDAGLPIAFAQAVPHNGTLEVIEGERVKAVYQDDNFPPDSSWVYIDVPSSSNVSCKDISDDGVVEISPNPFNSRTAITFTLKRSAEVELAIYDLTGRHIISPRVKQFSEGEHRFVWEASDFPSGIYFLRLKSNELELTKKLTLLK